MGDERRKYHYIKKVNNINHDDIDEAPADGGGG